jgi:plastocyanin
MRIARFLAAAVAASAVAVAVAAPGGAEGTKIFGVVGPGFTIDLTDAQGNHVTKLDPGQYELVVDDKSPDHNFRLTGPGVSIATTVEETGQKTFQITLSDGTYNYVCDPHAGSMAGLFTVGSGGSSGTGSSGGSTGSGGSGAGGGAAVKPSAPVGAALSLTVGPGFTITLKTKAGKPVTSLAAGAYTFVVRDRSSAHNAHLSGAGVNKATGVKFVGTSTMKLTLRNGKLAFVCDPHRTSMKGAVTVS